MYSCHHSFFFVSSSLLLFSPFPFFIGIKFIPLRTPGGEPIPESGLFVQIKRKLSSLTQQDSTAEDSTQVDRTETNTTEEYFGDANETDPSLLRERTSQQIADESDSGRPWSSPPNLESYFRTDEEEASWKSKMDELVRESRTSGGEKQLEVVAEVHDYADKSGSSSSTEKVVTVVMEPRDPGSFKGDEREEG